MPTTGRRAGHGTVGGEPASCNSPAEQPRCSKETTVRIFVAGGTGVLGRPLVEALVDRGHEVTASTHRTEDFSVIEALGARPALMDGLDDAAVRQAILETEPEVIINQMTALSAPSRDYARSRRRE
jgi:nucleoside-diphosphate-sugar epimerase